MLGWVALASLAAYLVTPDSAAGPRGDPVGFAYNLRYAGPALAVALTATPLASPLSATHRARTLTALVLVALVAITVDKPHLWPDRHLTGAVVIGLVALGASVASYRVRPARAAVAAVAAVAIVAAAAAGYPLQRHYLRVRYAYAPHVSSLARVWAFFRHVRDQRVGVVGTFGGFFDYPLYGLDDSNTVLYIARRGPHGSFTRIDACRAWRQTVNRAHLTYLVTTPGRDPWRPKHLQPSPETRWTKENDRPNADPVAVPVLEYRAQRQPVVVFRVTGPLDPATCPSV
jgi:hypothetical protein